MVLGLRDKEKFQNLLREVIVETCVKNFGNRCEIDGIICITIDLPRGSTDEVIAKFHEVINDSNCSKYSQRDAFFLPQDFYKGKHSPVVRESTSGLKNYLSAIHKDMRSSRSLTGITNMSKDIKNQRLDSRDVSSNSSPVLLNATTTSNSQQLSKDLEALFACGLCLSRFPTYVELERHFHDIHSSTITHFCDKCSIGFESEADCFSHRQSVHQQNSSSDVVDNLTNTARTSISTNRRKQLKPRKGIAEENQPEVDPGTYSRWENCEDDDGSLKDTPMVNENNNDFNQRNHNEFGECEMMDRNNVMEDSSSPDDCSRQIAILSCPLCKENFDQTASLEQHCHIAHRQYICSFCHVTFSQKINRDRHVYLKHSGMKPFPCPDCDASFTRRDALRKHLLKCKGGNQPTSFSPSSSARNSPLTSKFLSPLNSTLQNEQNDSLENGCNVKMEVEGLDCGLDLSHGSRKMTNHQEGIDAKLLGNQSMHFNQDEEFTDIRTPQGNRSNSDEEEDRASNDRLLIAHPLDDSFSSQHSLKTRQYKCDWCDEVIFGGTAYSEHCKLAHRRTPCLHCGKTFSQKGNMERHKRQHTGERPFSCPECQSSYTRRETLKSHMSQAHGLQLPQPQQQLRQLRQADQLQQQLLLGGSPGVRTLAEVSSESQLQSFEEDQLAIENTACE